MKFTVVWHHEVQEELAKLWLDAPDRTAVRIAAWAIDHDLSIDAQTKGTSIPDRLRQLTVPPLRVLFAVSEADCMVKVLEVSRC
jgi:hypothetical protein